MPGAKTGSNDKATRDTSKGATKKVSGGNEAGNKTAAQLAEDAKNRTIGHYVVGK